MGYPRCENSEYNPPCFVRGRLRPPDQKARGGGRRCCEQQRVRYSTMPKYAVKMLTKADHVSYGVEVGQDCGAGGQRHGGPHPP